MTGSRQGGGVERILYTIGHSNHSMEHFLDLLAWHGVELLVDIRSNPHSRFHPHFNKKRLEDALRGAGPDYLFLGHALGGKPKETEFYDDEGFVLYGRLARTQRFAEGLAILEGKIQDSRAAIMCAEEDPTSCHRRLLVGRVLRSRGVKLLHFRRDGAIRTEEELEEGSLTKERGAQASMLHDSEGILWRSAVAVRKRKT